MAEVATKKSTKTLFEISDDLLALDAILEEIGGDLSDPETDKVVTAWLLEAEKDTRTKFDNYGALVRKLEAEAAVAKEEAERFTMKKRARENRAAYLKNRLKAFMESRGMKKQETDRYTFNIQRNSAGQLVIEDKAKIEATYWVDQEEEKVNTPEAAKLVIHALDNGASITIGAYKFIDEKALVKDLSAGLDVEGAKYEVGTHLRIR